MTNAVSKWISRSERLTAEGTIRRRLSRCGRKSRPSVWYL